MANLEKFKDRARKFEAKEQWAKAIEEYVRAIEALEASPEIPDAELALYNRVGDLYQKIGDTQHAVVYYERAADKYHEIGLSNNAIALCNKALRIAPGRAQVYLKLGMMFASKGFAAEAKTNLLEYADRMQRAGQLEEAFKALKKFAEMTPGQDEIWAVLAQQARGTARTREQKEQVEKLLTEFEAKDRASQHRKTRASRSMITGEEMPEEAGPKKGDLIFLDLEPTPPRRAPARPKAEVAPELPAELEIQPQQELEIPPSTELEIEPTALVSEEEPAPVEPAPPLEIESTSLVGAEDTGLLGIEPTAVVEPEPVAPEPAAEPAGADIPLAEEPVVAETPEVEAAPAAELELPSVVEVEPPAAESGAAVAEEAHVPAEVAPSAEEPAGPSTELQFLDMGEIAAPPSLEELEARVASAPQDWEAHRLLGEALLEQGERERGLGALDAAVEGLEQSGELDAAHTITEELLRLEPNSIRHHQKSVELAYRQGDRQRLAAAYLELADALLRSGEAEKALAVYERVLEHDPGNARAKSAVETLAPPPAPPPAAGPGRRATPAPPQAPEPAGVGAGSGFVDLASLLLEEEAPKDTRMRIEDEEPSGDEEQDFQTMLTAFKRGVEANVEEEDFQSHYDLGIAYKEMGLLDEAIAEFQKALRSPEGRLKASEALGLCFFEKGQFTVADTIFRRALELPASGDAERIGLLYWLGRTQEELGRGADGLTFYNRVFAVDITFQDVSQRVQSLSRAGA
jgi:tetratricopeptide (TPR) repeat protein